ncbi:MAG: GrpB family protein [Methanomassiliicoccales archaeon]|jgi:GrpB-like predicted nucleotidyltransferase (UPF0157 family)|nr:GrpB family protein [Methanomassiliicoccales archaeon]
MALDPDDPIDIVDSDPGWTSMYAEERDRLLSALEGLSADLYHIGSTAVPDLAAKPVIDILLAIRSLDEMGKIAGLVAPLGYVPVPIDDPERRFFRKGAPRTHHLHVVRRGSWAQHRHIWFRDYLREHALASEEYECLKRLLASRCKFDREAYVEGKGAMVSMILKRAVRERLLLPTYSD